MLTTIFSAVGGKIIDSLLGKITGVFEAYFKKQISLEELKTKVSTAMLETFAEVEKAHADALAKTYTAFMGAVVQSKIMQAMWASVVGSQLFVLLWHQFGIPFIVFMGWTARYPSSGTTVEWAYLLLAACLGMGPVVLRSGPGAGNLTERLKGLIGK